MKTKTINKLRLYITEIRQITYTKAASDLKITRQHLSDIVCNKKIPGRKTALKIEKWSKGFITAIELMRL